MKLVTFRYDAKEQVGVMTQDLKAVVPLKAMGFDYCCMNNLIETASKEDLAKIAEAALQNTDKAIAFEEVELQAPIPRPMQDLVCVGRNYVDHIKEGARFRLTDFDATDKPSVYFSKRVNRAVPCGGFIEAHADVDEQLDYEAELGVIIGKDAYKVSKENAGEYVFGYTIINDVSARRTQNAHKQWYMGKSFDGFTPMGPWIVTADEFASFPPSLTVQSKVNGELRQNTNTDLMIYDVPYIISELTSGMTLLAGSVIATGTPAGVGMGFVPPRWLKSGDVVECIISEIGTLTNTVR